MKRIEVVAGIILWEGKILCMQRNKGRFDYISYKFEFPGGKVEPGESNTEALIRELREEMELDIAVREEDHFMTVEHDYPDFSVKMHAYLCRTETDRFIMKEHVAFRWLSACDLHELDWAPADIAIIGKLEAAYCHE